MTIENTLDIHVEDNIAMILYGRGGVGKTTFAASAPRPLLIDFENGSKFLGERGFDCSVIRMKEWFTHDDLLQLKGILPNFDTVILDPIGEAMEKLINSSALDGKKFRQSDGSLSMAGWGEAKKQMKSLVKWLRDSGKNVILVAHVAEGKDGENTTYRIQIATKLSDELPTMVDIISYMGVRKNSDGKKEVILYTPAQGGNFDSKDRTGRLPEVIAVSERNGWNDFMTAMGQAPKPAGQNIPVQQPVVYNPIPLPQSTVYAHPVMPIGAPVQAQNPAQPQQGPSDAWLTLEQLKDNYGIQLQGEPYQMILSVLNKPGVTDAELTAMTDRCKRYLNQMEVQA